MCFTVGLTIPHSHSSPALTSNNYLHPLPPRHPSPLTPHLHSGSLKRMHVCSFRYIRSGRHQDHHPGPQETLHHSIKLLQAHRPKVYGHEILQETGVDLGHHRPPAGPTTVCRSVDDAVNLGLHYISISGSRWGASHPAPGQSTLTPPRVVCSPLFSSPLTASQDTRLLNSWSLQMTQQSLASSRTVSNLHKYGMMNSWPSGTVRTPPFWTTLCLLWKPSGFWDQHSRTHRHLI